MWCPINWGSIVSVAQEYVERLSKSRQLKLLPGVGAKKHATVEVRALALANHAKGMTVREVAEVAKVSERTMYYWLATWSAPFPL